MIAWRPATAAMDQERFEVRPLIVGHQSANQGCPPQKIGLTTDLDRRGLPPVVT